LDRVFLDANVLFSAAYCAEGSFCELWRRKGIQLLTSDYAVQEARRNLTGDDGSKRLEQLTATMEIVPSCAGILPSDTVLDANLPEKDQPILAAAISARATHLLTGDRRHFGNYYGKRVGGVLIQPPAQYLLKKPRP
jgi:predicted nucleic acid-binding protein